MKSLARWSTTLGLVCTALVGSLFSGNLSAIALTEEQVIAALRTVPVFMIAQANGIPISQCVTPDTGQPASCDTNNIVVVTPLFISPQDAQTALTQLKTSQPEQARTLQIMPRSLGFVYKQLEAANKNQQQRIAVDFLPRQQQVNAAIALLQQNGQKVERFPGVPLFVAVATVGDQKIYLPGKNGDREVIPLFFEKEELQSNLQEITAQNPEIASKVSIEVITLEDVISTLKNDNDPVLEKFFLQPSREAVQYIQTNPQTPPTNQSPNPRR
ncbi:MAG TPA: hypothetical protein DEG17_20280 [Cyanobacteria bacterium UBA11149]|nr:hypothetical protein [Cyanobacteria bacterium UBA11367]HBE56540.1 hypothetical protein [Cyanobacteria bacterium UBA11366]HBK62366.1 hypothetical protein [Cyanobacteria bacterium UBA11166]HBR75671.1 hypothetical protein [Cyanobacteria bacterium UBA11159]HBS68601.1 hypothetical protein [Cyanobacteria bacterium UBA11153]HBW91134.1 hypothetical protein [Cyanobacteria bacterium UBA11149]HCA97994.1 hypothetical protein [Cyanobacteria bacterium UBA9226]